MKKTIFIALLLLLLRLPEVRAQQDAQYTQYMYNTVGINPGYAGSRGRPSMAGMYRSQWAGLEGAPETQTLNLHSPIGASRVGYGISILNDNIGDGTVQQTYFDAAISYTIDVSRYSRLAFGLDFGGNVLNLDVSKLENYYKEPIALDDIENKFSPNFGLGIYYYSDRFYAGLSAPHLLETEHFDNAKSQAGDHGAISFLSKDRISFYLMTGYVFDLDYRIKFKPALLVKAVGGASLQVDLSANFMFNNKFIAGLAYRWSASVSGLFGFRITDQFMLGLAYDRETTELGGTSFNNGSFEFVLRFELNNRYRRLVTPKFF